MSSEIAVRARGLGKRFDMFANSAGALIRHFTPLRLQSEYWALRHVDLDIARGSCLGIMGRNGSGKSTLLSLLAGIQTPSEGTFEVKGRVAALIELGAGFHPDYTGRENVRLSAAIYGLTDAMLDERMALIEEFADIGEFIDRPVREYSSGMYARLAFAVVAHVDADILIIDEILGVGDIRFQQRCARFIQDFRARGIVLLVSHSEATVLALCDQAIWLAGGNVLAQGAPRDVARAYHAATQLEASGNDQGFTSPVAVAASIEPDHAEQRDWSLDQLPPASGLGHLRNIELRLRGHPASSMGGGENLVLRVTYDAGNAARPAIAFVLRDRIGIAVVGGDSSEFPGGDQLDGAGSVEFAFQLPFMTSGDYTLDVVLLDLAHPEPLCLARDAESTVLHVLSRHISSGMGSVAQHSASFLIDGEVVAP